MAGRQSKGAGVYIPPGMDPQHLGTLRPEVVARLELLRIVWRPDRDAATAIKACQELEQYLHGQAPE
jgi:hypothetical protein